MDEENPIYKDLADVPDYWNHQAAGLLNVGAVNGGTPTEVCETDLNIRRETLKAAIMSVMYHNADINVKIKTCETKSVIEVLDKLEKKLRETTAWINNYPRKMFDFHTSAEAFEAAFPGAASVIPKILQNFPHTYILNQYIK